MDITYETIPVWNESKRLYSEKRFPYVVSNQTQPYIHHVYVVDIDLGSSIFFNDISLCNPKVIVPLKDEKEARKLKAAKRKQMDKGVWTMYFDGSVSKEASGAGVYIVSPIKDTKNHS